MRLIGLILLCLTACTPAPETSLKVASNTWVGYEPLYIAKEFNLYPSPNSLTIERHGNATSVMESFAQGKVDVAAVTLDEAMQLLQQDVSLHVFAVMDISDGADQVMVANDIPDISKLKGKAIGVEDTALGSLMLYSFLTHSGIEQNDIKVVPSTVDQHASLFAAGSISAAITFPPFSEELAKLGAKTMFDSSQMHKVKIVDVLIASADAMKNKQTQLKQLTMAVRDAAKSLIALEPEILAFSGANLGLERSLWPTMLDGVQIADKNVNVEYLHRYRLESIMLILDDIMVKNNLLESSIKNKINSELFVRF